MSQQGSQPFGMNQQPGGQPFGMNQQPGGQPFGMNQQPGGQQFVMNQQSGGQPFGMNQQPGGQPFGMNQQPGGQQFGMNQQSDGQPFGMNQQPGGQPFGMNQQPGQPFGMNQQPAGQPFGMNQQPGVQPAGTNQQPDAQPFASNQQSGMQPFSPNQQPGVQPMESVPVLTQRGPLPSPTGEALSAGSLPAELLGSWSVSGNCTKLEIRPDFVDRAQSGFTRSSTMSWTFKGKPGKYMLVSGHGPERVKVGQCTPNTAFFSSLRNVGKSGVEQLEGVVIQLQADGRTFYGMERITVSKPGETSFRAQATYNLVGTRTDGKNEQSSQTAPELEMNPQLEPRQD
jgi:hypothetical protein